MLLNKSPLKTLLRSRCYLDRFLSNANKMTSLFNITMNDGIPIPILGYGTATALIRKDAKDWVKMAYNDAKLRHIDTAAYYENENTVGEALKELGITREDVFITTKCKSFLPPRYVQLIAS